MHSNKHSKINNTHRDTGRVESKRVRPPTAEHGRVRFELTAGSAGEQAEGHVSQVEVQVNHLVNEILSDVERCEVVRGVEPDDSVQITDSAAAGFDAGLAENVGDQQIAEGAQGRMLKAQEHQTMLYVSYRHSPRISSVTR